MNAPRGLTSATRTAVYRVSWSQLMRTTPASGGRRTGTRATPPRRSSRRDRLPSSGASHEPVAESDEPVGGRGEADGNGQVEDVGHGSTSGPQVTDRMVPGAASRRGQDGRKGC